VFTSKPARCEQGVKNVGLIADLVLLAQLNSLEDKRFKGPLSTPSPSPDTQHAQTPASPPLARTNATRT